MFRPSLFACFIGNPECSVKIVCTVRRRLSNGKTGGTIREGGGAFGRRERAQEEQYFRRKEQEEIKALNIKKKDKKSPEPKSD